MAKKCEEHDSISTNSLKLGQFVQLQDDDKVYVVIRKGQKIRLLPVDQCNYKEYHVFDLKQPDITRVYDGRNGDCVMIKKGVL